MSKTSLSQYLPSNLIRGKSWADITDDETEDDLWLTSGTVRLPTIIESQVTELELPTTAPETPTNVPEPEPKIPETYREPKREPRRWNKPPQRLEPLSQIYDCDNDITEDDVSSVTAILSTVDTLVSKIDIKSAPKKVPQARPQLQQLYTKNIIQEVANEKDGQVIIKNITKRIEALKPTTGDPIGIAYDVYNSGLHIPTEQQIQQIPDVHDVSTAIKRRMLEVSKRYFNKIHNINLSNAVDTETRSVLENQYNGIREDISGLLATKNITVIVDDCSATSTVEFFKDIHDRIDRVKRVDGLRYVVSSPNIAEALTFKNIATLKTELQSRRDTVNTGFFNLDKHYKDTDRGSSYTTIHELLQSLRDTVLDRLISKVHRLEHTLVTYLTSGKNSDYNDLAKMNAEFKDLMENLFCGYSTRHLQCMLDTAVTHTQSLVKSPERDDGFVEVKRGKLRKQVSASTISTASSSSTVSISRVNSRVSSVSSSGDSPYEQLSNLLGTPFSAIADSRSLYFEEGILVSSLQYLNMDADVAKKNTEVQLLYPRIGRAPVAYPLRWDIIHEPLYRRKICNISMNGRVCPGFARMAQQYIGCPESHEYANARMCPYLHPGIRTRNGYIPIDVQWVIDDRLQNVRLFEFYPMCPAEFDSDHVHVDSKWTDNLQAGTLIYIVPNITRRKLCGFDGPKPGKDNGFPMCKNLAFKDGCDNLHKHYQTVVTSLLLNVVLRCKGIPESEWESVCGNTLGRIMYSTYDGVHKYIEWFNNYNNVPQTPPKPGKKKTSTVRSKRS